MTVKNLFAIMFIFAMTALAWLMLGSSLSARSHVQGLAAQKVAELWGQPQAQSEPIVTGARGGIAVPVELASSMVAVDLKLNYRRVGLLWYPAYKVTFDGLYEVQNADTQPLDCEVTFKPPASTANLDDFVFEAVEGSPLKAVGADKIRLNVAPGQSGKVKLHYVSRGMDRWAYDFGKAQSNVRNFELAVHTDFKDIDFKTISPNDKRESSGGWDLIWKYANSRLANASITIEMPQIQNPGDLAGRISYFAPVSLLFFLTVMVVITVIKKVEIHPMNYFFVSAAFFGFHLLLAYLVDHIDVHTAFLISACVSVFLVMTYLRLVTGAQFALLYAGSAQLVFLVGFSYAFFFEGYAGLAVTIGALATLFVLMQVTGRVKWSEVFHDAGARPVPPLPSVKTPETPTHPGA